MLRLVNINSFYKTIHALKDISLHVEEQEIVVLIGANGAGKTTLLKSIAGLLRPRSGTIRFQDKQIERWSSPEIVASGISLVPEGRQIFSRLSVMDNLLLGAYHRMMTSDNDVKPDIELAFDLFPVLYNRKDQPGGTLSGGEQQMLAIGRALMAKPKILLLDEPSMGLAPLIVNEIFTIIKELRERGSTILLVEQNAKKALSVADRGYVLETGRIVVEGSSEELIENQAVQKAYMGRSRQSFHHKLCN
ncbi:MAG: ABC transporter ATP-binding protein [Desulfobacteraceae bacterium IS3]|nr:MAG: ABC transporter ATP-binding protein [Desulfobacteraceae bacterium IS3]